MRLPFFLATALVAWAGPACGERSTVDCEKCGERGTLAFEKVDCEKKVPADAEALFGRVADAFRGERAADVTSAIWPAREGRLYLKLAGLRESPYTRELATTALADTYFATRDVLTVRPAEGCTTGGETFLSRTYRLRVRVDRREVDGTLTIQLTNRKVDEQTSKWFLHALMDA